MEYSARQIAEVLKGTVEGDPGVMVSNLSKIEEGKPGTLSFLANPVYTKYIYTTEASVIVVNRDFVPSQPVAGTLIRVENAYAAFANLLEIFTKKKAEKSGISPLCYISESAKIGENVYIGEFAFIGEHAVIGNNARIYPQVYIGENAVVGDSTTLHPGVKLYYDSVVGKNCLIHSGVVVGADGFGFAPQAGTEYKKIPQTGNVVIEDNVEIGANTTIDRATLGSTMIHSGVKLDNQIRIAHNAEIGENTVIAGLSGVAGSTKVGRNCMIAAQVGIAGHITIGDNVIIGARSGVESDIKDGAIVLGAPAVEFGKAKRLYVIWKNLDQVVNRINQIEKLLKNK
jgi:UDP-3-O-[3-hydroxymyristoyl] glucosamine N-acyltransferase